MKAAPAGLETMRLDGFCNPIGGVLLLSEGVEQSGEQAFFAFLLCGAVTALSTTKSGIEQIPEGISEHVETENDHRQAKPGPERQPKHARLFHADTA